MNDDKTKTGERGFTGKATGNSENIEAALADSVGGEATSVDFRETLLKSGLDVSAFRVDEAEKLSDGKPLAVGSFDFSENQNKTESKIFENPAKNVEKKFSPFRRWQHFAAVAGIAAVIALQSVFQFSFIQEEKLRASENTIKNALPAEKNFDEKAQAEISETKTSETPAVQKNLKAETKTEYKAAKTPVQTKSAAPKLPREIRQTPVRTASRKKETGETTAERLRRVEKILTGV